MLSYSRIAVVASTTENVFRNRLWTVKPAPRSVLSGKLLLLTLFLPIAGYAQTARQVTGKVLDGTGGGLPGVTVLVPGTTTGTSTGADGGFQVQVPANATKLSFSFVGYATQT
nr:hypothetical protein [Tanacetum cinerariifolium]